jgi:hypothetical protein
MGVNLFILKFKLRNTASDSLISVTFETEVMLVALVHKIEALIVMRQSKNDNIKIFSLFTP